MSTDDPRQTIARALGDGRRRLEQASVPDAGHDAELLLAQLLELDRGAMLVRREERIDPALAERYADWIERRAGREPLQHILGTQEFHGLEFEVDGRVLIPRQETEGLVDAVLDLDLPRGARVADFGTGSGCIIVALGVRRADFELLALDCSADALQVARRNAERHGVAGRIELVRGDLAQPPAAWRGTLDALVSNPPYVPEGDWQGLQREVRDHDPRAALVGGPEGLEAYAALAPVALEWLAPGGWVALELGFGLATKVRALVEGAGFGAIAVLPDLRGIPRVLVGQKP